MPNNFQSKKIYFSYVLAFLLFLLLYSSYYSQNSSLFGLKPLFQAQIADLYPQNITNFIISLPYYLIIALLGFLLILGFKRADKEYKAYLRRMIRFIGMGIGTILLFLTLSYFGPKSFSNPSFIPGNNSTSTSTTSVTSSTTSIVSSAGGNPNPGSISATIIPAGNYGNLNVLILVLLVVVLLLVVLASRLYRQNFKGMTISKPKRQPDKIHYDQLKLSIINEYLKLSKVLEEKGINPDFSLTPIEFDTETKANLKLTEFQTVTYYYELARFSADSLSPEDLEIFEKNVKAVYDKINHIEKITKNHSQNGGEE